jgi:predicted DCC family thiol-disulfide oxidoreductase YuxK
MTPELRRQARTAVQVITNEGRQLSAGRATLFILEEIGWHPTLVRLGQRWPFIWMVEWGYRIVARHRAFFARFMFPSMRCV